MPPEALKDRIYSVKTDIWSFGVVIWEVICRSEPYPEYDAVQASSRVVYEGLRVPIPTSCHPVFSQVMKQCFETDPGHNDDSK